MQSERPARTALLARLPGALIVLDPGGTIRWADESVAELLGWPATDLAGRPVATVLPDWPAADETGILGAVTLSARRPDGRHFAVVVVAGPAPEPGRCLLVNRAAGEPNAEDATQHVGAAAHELGNLVGVIRNYATLLARSSADEAARADLDQIQAAARRCGELARDLVGDAEGRGR